MSQISLEQRLDVLRKSTVNRIAKLRVCVGELQERAERFRLGQRGADTPVREADGFSLSGEAVKVQRREMDLPRWVVGDLKAAAEPLATLRDDTRRLGDARVTEALIEASRVSGRFSQLRPAPAADDPESVNYWTEIANSLQGVDSALEDAAGLLGVSRVQARYDTSNELRLQVFRRRNKRTVAWVMKAANVDKKNMRQWRKDQMSPESVMAGRIEAVLAGK